MSGGGQQPVQTTTQTNTPWGPVAQGYEQTIPQAEQFQQQGTGYIPWGGPTMGDINVMQTQGENMAQDIAMQGVPAGITNAMNLGAAMTGNAWGLGYGITPEIQKALTGLGQVGHQYSDIYSDPTTTGAYTNVINNMGQQNPYLQQLLDTQNRRISDTINSQFSGAGRYGSGMQQDVTARALAEAEAPELLQDWTQRQQMGLGAAGALANQQLQATQGLGQTQGAIADIYGQGLGRAGQWAQLMPALQQAQYYPSQVMQQMGNYYTQRNQQQLNNTIGLYNAGQAWPWEQLARENAIIGGAGGLGGTSTGTSTTSVPRSQQILGGALLGGGLGSAFGPVGTGLGAVGGGLAGGFL